MYNLVILGQKLRHTISPQHPPLQTAFSYVLTINASINDSTVRLATEPKVTNSQKLEIQNVLSTRTMKLTASQKALSLTQRLPKH